MPQNVVVGRQATDVAEFVATFAGRGAPKIPGQTPCQSRAIGTLVGIAQQAAYARASATPTTPATTATPATTTPATTHAAAKKAVAVHKAKRKP
jgi:hypothetical protein